jgi:hypothetical protein
MGPGRDLPQPRVTTLGQQQHPTPPRGDSEAATWPEKVMYSKASTMSPDPHGRVPDPWIYGPDLQVGPRPPRVRTGPLEWDPDPPPYRVWTAHSGVPRPYLRPRRGSGADTCPDLLWCAPDLSAYTSAPRSGGAPMLPRGILRVA